MKYKTIRIEVTGPAPCDVRVFLDGVRLENFTNLVFRVAHDLAPELTMTTFPDSEQEEIKPDAN